MAKHRYHKVQPYGCEVELGDLLRLQMFAQLLDLSHQKRIRSQQSGGFMSPFRGRGMEFDEVRSYQPGDDVRMIDWRVTARTGEVHTKLFREERERPIFFFVDQTASMQFGTRNAFKSVVGAQAAGLLAWAAMANGDRIGAVVTGSQQHRELKPVGGKRGVLRLLRAMSQARQQPGEDGDAEAFRSGFLRLCRIARPGSLVYLISDFRHLEIVRPYFNLLCRHNDLALIFLYDSMEFKAPPPGYYPVTNGRQRYLWNTRQQAKPLRDRFFLRYNRLQQLCQQLRSHLITMATDQEILSPLREALHHSAAKAIYLGGLDG